MARLASAEAPPPFCASDAARFTLSVVDPAFAPYFLTPSAPGVDTFGVDPKPTPSIPSAALIPAPYFPSRAAAILRAAEVEAPPPARFAAVTLALRRELDVVLALKLAPPPSARGAGNVAFATSSICPRKCGVWPWIAKMKCQYCGGTGRPGFGTYNTDVPSVCPGAPRTP